MQLGSSRYTRFLLIAATLILGSACIAETTQVVIIVTATPGPGDNSQPIPTATEETQDTEEVDQIEPTAEEPTFTPTPTPTPTLTPVTMTAGQSLSCVKGPHWILYGWVAGITEGETVTLLAKSAPEWDEYYYVRKSDGTECWAFGGSSTKSGDYLSLPVREAPPLPEVKYVIENNTGLEICDVLIREKGAGSWGADRLGAGSILPGASFGVDLTAGFYDVLIKDCFAGATLYEEYGRAIGADEGYRYTAVDTKVKFSVQNDTGNDLCWFAFKPAGGSWMELHTEADGHIGPGEKVWFTLLVGFYDINIDRCNGTNSVFLTNHYFGPNSTSWSVS